MALAVQRGNGIKHAAHTSRSWNQQHIAACVVQNVPCDTAQPVLRQIVTVLSDDDDIEPGRGLREDLRGRLAIGHRGF